MEDMTRVTMKVLTPNPGLRGVTGVEAPGCYLSSERCQWPQRKEAAKHEPTLRKQKTSK